MSWTDNSSDETGFRIERRLAGGGSFAQVGTAGVDSTTFTDTSLTLLSAQYEYRVFASNAAGDSAPSTVAAVGVSDDHGNGAASASPLTVNVSEPGEIELPADVDWFAVDLIGGKDYTFRTVTVGNTALALYDAQGALLAQNDDEDALAGLRNSLISFRVPATGRYYLEVSGSGGGTPAYDLEAIAPFVQGTIEFFGARLTVTNDSLIWVIDASGSMGIAAAPFYDHQGQLVSNGSRMQRTASEVAISINALPSSHTFNIVVFTHCPTSMWATRRAATSANKQAAIAWILAVTTDGWTNTSLGVSTALADSANQTLIVVSDGKPNFLDCGQNYVGTPQDHQAVITAANTQGANIHAAALLPDAETRSFLQGVATTSGGVYWEPDISTSPPPAPAAPSNLTAVALAANKVDLSWTDNASNETGFRIERSPAGQAAFVLVGSTVSDVTSFSDTSVLGSTSYDYRVLAVNGASPSLPSNVVSATTPSNGLTPPTNLAAAAVGPTQVDLTWTDTTSSETGFRIERRPQGAGSFVFLGSVGVDVTSFSDMTPQPATAYEYRVMAINALGNSLPSNVASATTQVPPPPQAPTGLSATVVSYQRVNLSWTDNATLETGYRVERRASGGTFTLLASLAADQTLYFDASVAPATSYEYRVVATNAGGSSAPSNVASATTPSPPPPAPPTNLVATPLGQTEVRLTWSDGSNDETGFRIERRQGAGSFTALVVVGANATSYTDPSASAATAYDYRVIAEGPGGDSTPAVASVVTLPNPPAAPTNLVATVVGPTQVDLSWTDNAGNETGFRVERSLQGAGAYAVLTTTNADSTGYADPSAAAGTSYDYRVVATNSGGDSSAATATAATPLAAPGDVWAGAGPGAAMVSWAKVPGAASYTVYRDTSPGVTPQGAGPNFVVTSNATSPLLLRGLTGGTTYHFVVVATGATGAGVTSLEVSATPSAAPAATSPTVHALALSFGTITDIRVDPLRRRLFLVDASSNELVGVDLVTEQVLGRVPLSTGARALSLSPSTRYLVAVSAIQGFAYTRATMAGDLFQVDPQLVTLSGQHRVAVDPWDVEVLDTGFVYTASGSDQWTEIFVHEATTGVELGRLHFARQRMYITATPDQTRLYSISTDLSPLNAFAWRLAEGRSQTVSRYSNSYHGFNSDEAPIAVNADSTRGLTTTGHLVALGGAQPGGSASMASLTTFSDRPHVPAASADPRYMYGFASTGELIRYDVINFTSQRYTGYDVTTLGSPSHVRLGPLGQSVIVATSLQRVVVVPVP